jgi:hypothetical protein
MGSNQYISLKDAAMMADRSTQTIRRLVKANKIRYRKYKTPQGFTYLVEKSSLLAHFTDEDEMDDAELVEDFEPPQRAQAPQPMSNGVHPTQPVQQPAPHPMPQNTVYPQADYPQAETVYEPVQPSQSMPSNGTHPPQMNHQPHVQPQTQPQPAPQPQAQPVTPPPAATMQSSLPHNPNNPSHSPTHPGGDLPQNFQHIVNELIRQHRNDKNRLFELLETFQKRILTLEEHIKQLEAPKPEVKKKGWFSFLRK